MGQLGAEGEDIFCNADYDMKAIEEKEKLYIDLPKFYSFGSKEQKERILYENFMKVSRDVELMCRESMQFAKK